MGSIFSLSSQISLYMAFSITASLVAFCGLVSACIQVAYLARTKNGLEDDSSYTNPCRPDYNIEIITDESMECVPRSSFSTECVTRQEIDSCVEEVSGTSVSVFMITRWMLEYHLKGKL